MMLVSSSPRGWRLLTGQFLVHDVVEVAEEPVGILLLDGRLDSVLWFAFDDGRISRIYAVRNPHKLGHLAEQT